MGGVSAEIAGGFTVNSTDTRADNRWVIVDARLPGVVLTLATEVTGR